ncbi:hypothetical protein FANTH_7762 [Fusarium anthophilum]|uniref:3-isopropylmalate dehydratase n=1 Tax=Fusarium anthophilum TaxID=48485 RepID=A0A8H4ZCM4_9HYPO|nr:hypothetical protein FANTH_7762 [Fusarium anthophilum]
MAAAAAIIGKLADVRKISQYTTTSPHAKAQITPAGKARIDKRVEEYIEGREAIAEQSEGSEPHTNTPTAAAAGSSGGASLVKFLSLKGIAAPLNKSNVDTDTIIPKQFLKTIKRTSLGSAAFQSWRYNYNSSKNASFVLNQEPYCHASIIVCTGSNFGYSSSYKHAPWALLDFSIKYIIAPLFANIFFNNTFKNGMLPLKINNRTDLNAIANKARAGRKIKVNLPTQVIKNAAGDKICSFEVKEFRKHCLINGLDNIGLTMQIEDKIAAFKMQITVKTPWLDGTGYLRRGRDGRLAAKAVPVPKTNRGEEKKEPLEW